jgi:archaellum component FlaC
MTAALLTMVGIMIAALLGCLWYVLTRVGAQLDGIGTRIDALEERLRQIEENFTRVDNLGDQFQAVEARVRSVEDRTIRWEERFSYAEDRITEILSRTEAIDKRISGG